MGKIFKKLIVFCCIAGLVSADPAVYAAGAAYDLPMPGQLIGVSAVGEPARLKGIKVDRNDPFVIEFLFDSTHEVSPQEFSRLVEYFLACLTMPEENLYVNLSPYEPEQVCVDGLAITGLGRDMLSQDYLLKQLAASLTYPETEAGKAYWHALQGGRNTADAAIASSGASLPPRDASAGVAALQKVWIAPAKALVYEHECTAMIEEASLKALVDTDRNALKYGPSAAKESGPDLAAFKTCILPLIEKEVNQGKNFSKLRQIYSSFILAAWFKKKLKDSVYRYYIDHNKVAGIDNVAKGARQDIYNLYVEAFKRGAYDYIRKEYNPLRHATSRRRYFSGGIELDFSQTGGGGLAVIDPGEVVVARRANAANSRGMIGMMANGAPLFTAALLAGSIAAYASGALGQTASPTAPAAASASASPSAAPASSAAPEISVGQSEQFSSDHNLSTTTAKVKADGYDVEGDASALGEHPYGGHFHLLAPMGPTMQTGWDARVINGGPGYAVHDLTFGAARKIRGAVVSGELSFSHDTVGSSTMDGTYGQVGVKAPWFDWTGYANSVQYALNWANQAPTTDSTSALGFKLGVPSIDSTARFQYDHDHGVDDGRLRFLADVHQGALRFYAEKDPLFDNSREAQVWANVFGFGRTKSPYQLWLLWDYYATGSSSTLGPGNQNNDTNLAYNTVGVGGVVPVAKINDKPVVELYAVARDGFMGDGGGGKGEVSGGAKSRWASAGLLGGFYQERFVFKDPKLSVVRFGAQASISNLINDFLAKKDTGYSLGVGLDSRWELKPAPVPADNPLFTSDEFVLRYLRGWVMAGSPNGIKLYAGLDKWNTYPSESLFATVFHDIKGFASLFAPFKIDGAWHGTMGLNYAFGATGQEGRITFNFDWGQAPAYDPSAFDPGYIFGTGRYEFENGSLNARNEMGRRAPNNFKYAQANPQTSWSNFSKTPSGAIAATQIQNDVAWTQQGYPGAWEARSLMADLYGVDPNQLDPAHLTSGQVSSLAKFYFYRQNVRAIQVVQQMQCAVDLRWRFINDSRLKIPDITLGQQSLEGKKDLWLLRDWRNGEPYCNGLDGRPLRGLAPIEFKFDAEKGRPVDIKPAAPVPPVVEQKAVPAPVPPPTAPVVETPVDTEAAPAVDEESGSATEEAAPEVGLPAEVAPPAGEAPASKIDTGAKRPAKKPGKKPVKTAPPTGDAEIGDITIGGPIGRWKYKKVSFDKTTHRLSIFGLERLPNAKGKIEERFQPGKIPPVVVIQAAAPTARQSVQVEAAKKLAEITGKVDVEFFVENGVPKENLAANWLIGGLGDPSLDGLNLQRTAIWEDAAQADIAEYAMSADQAGVEVCAELLDHERLHGVGLGHGDAREAQYKAKRGNATQVIKRRFAQDRKYGGIVFYQESVAVRGGAKDYFVVSPEKAERLRLAVTVGYQILALYSRPNMPQQLVYNRPSGF